MFRVADAMTPHPVTIRDTDHLGIAESLMRTGLESIRHLPVLRQGRLVGVLSQRDLLRAGPEAARQPVAQAMSGRVRTTRPGTPLRRALRQLRQHKLGCLPVVDAAGQLVGILTVSDVLRFALGLVTDLDRAASTRRAPRAELQVLGLSLGPALPHRGAR